MLELARLISSPKFLAEPSGKAERGEVRRGLNAGSDSLPTVPHSEEIDAPSDPQPPNLGGLNLGVDFICFDAEDWGTPQWDSSPDRSETWALGAQYWAANPHVEGYKARYGILLDMVGGQGAQFYQEQQSLQYARSIVDKVWRASQVVGFGSFFPMKEGGGITDDHLPVNRVAKIPCIDIIPYYPDCQQSSFGPTWHTLQDDMDHIDRNTLQAVGQTLVQVLFLE